MQAKRVKLGDFMDVFLFDLHVLAGSIKNGKNGTCMARSIRNLSNLNRRTGMLCVGLVRAFHQG